VPSRHLAPSAGRVPPTLLVRYPLHHKAFPLGLRWSRKPKQDKAFLHRTPETVTDTLTEGLASSRERSTRSAGWIQYDGAYYRTALYPFLQRINAYLVRWMRRRQTAATIPSSAGLLAAAHQPIPQVIRPQDIDPPTLLIHSGLHSCCGSVHDDGMTFEVNQFTKCLMLGRRTTAAVYFRTHPLVRWCATHHLTNGPISIPMMRNAVTAYVSSGVAAITGATSDSGGVPCSTIGHNNT